MEARQRALIAALDAMMEWLESGVGQVAIFDATNSTVSRRQFLVSFRVVECIYFCNDNNLSYTEGEATRPMSISVH